MAAAKVISISDPVKTFLPEQVMRRLFYSQVCHM
jgi:hypothetical protein